MELTINNLKEMSKNGSEWVLNGKTIEGYKSWGFWNKYDIVENGEVVGTLEYKVGEGFVVIMNGEMKLRDWQNAQEETIETEIAKVETIKELGDSTIKTGDKVNLNGQVLTFKTANIFEGIDIMSKELRARLEQLNTDYLEVIDALNLQKANGNLSKLCDLQSHFDETFDRFFDDEEIARKYNDWDEEEERRVCNRSNSDIEDLLDDEDLEKLINFYENYVGILEDELNECVSNDVDLEEVLSLQEAAEIWSLNDGYLRNVIAGRYKEKQFQPNEYRKTGRNYIIKKSAMERLYGEPSK